jgi:DNA-binding NarL/FixJ family response regulator
VQCDKIRIGIVHSDGLYRESLTHCLVRAGRILSVLSAATLENAGEAILACRPELLLLQFGISRCYGGRTVADLRALVPELKIIVVGVPNTDEDILSCIEDEGAAGYLLTDASLDDLMNNVQAVMRGETLCSPRIASLAFSRVFKLVRQVNHNRPHNGTSLTRREAEIVNLIEKGLSNKEIALQLHIELSTVKNHVHNLLDKLQLHSRYSAVKYAKAQGLISTCL